MTALSRRRFLSSGAALAPFSRVLGANDAIRLAVVGVGSTVKNPDSSAKTMWGRPSRAAFFSPRPVFLLPALDLGAPPGLAAEIKCWREISIDTSPEALVFPSERGTYLSRDNFLRRNIHRKLEQEAREGRPRLGELPAGDRAYQGKRGKGR
jgi:hypothetical protein